MTTEVIERSLEHLHKFPAVRFMHKEPFAQILFDQEVEGFKTFIDKHGHHILAEVYETVEAQERWKMVSKGGWGLSYGFMPDRVGGITQKCFNTGALAGKCFDAFVKGRVYEYSVVDAPAHPDAVAYVISRIVNGHTGETVSKREKKEKNLEKAEIEQLLKEREERFMEDVKKLIGGKKADDFVEASVKAMEERLRTFITEEMAKLAPIKDPSELERTFENVNNEVKALDDKITALRKLTSEIKAQGESPDDLVNRIAELEKTREELANSVTASVEKAVKKQLKGVNDRLGAIENLPDYHSPANATGQPILRGQDQGFRGMLDVAFRREQ